MVGQPVPKPHDPLRVVTREEITAKVDAILGEDATDPQAVCQQLERAHDVLRTALQDN